MADFRRPHTASGNSIDRRKRMKGMNNGAADSDRPFTEHRVRSRNASGDSVDDSLQRRRTVDERWVAS